MEILLPVESDFDTAKLPKRTDLATILNATNQSEGFWLQHDTTCDSPFMMNGGTVHQASKAERSCVVPMIKASDIASLNVKMKDDQFEYGEYPQTIEQDVMVITELEDAIENDWLSETGRIFTFEDSNHQGSFHAINCPEYEYNGNKYIRVVAPASITSSVKTENGWLISPSEKYWIKVEPIVWKKSKISGNFVATKQLIGGITYSYQDVSDCRNFEDTAIYNYLDNYFKSAINSVVNINLAQSNEQTSKAKNEKESYSSVGKDVSDAQINEIATPAQPVRQKLSRQERYGIQVDTMPMTVTEQINFYVQNGMSFMLHGPSGVGKTARVEQIDPDLTAVPLWNGVLPEDIVGKVRYPDGVEKAAVHADALSVGEWVAPDWYVELQRKCQEEPNKMHVLFIDEVTNARPTTQSLIFHITLKRSISPSKGKLPDNAVVILAGNSKDESGAAYNMPEPLFRRMCGHIYLKADVKEWLAWGSQQDKHYPNEDRLNIHPLVASFVATYGKKCFYSAYDEEEAPKWALDPRGWKQISDIIYNNGGLIQKELLVSKMGPENAISFIGYAKNPPLAIDDILDHSYADSDIPRSTDEKLALTLSLRYAYVSELPVVREFIKKRLGRENLDVFDAAWVAGDAERALQLQSVIRSEGRGRV